MIEDHLRGLSMLALGVGSLLAMVDRWVSNIPVVAIGGVVLFYLGIGSGVQLVRDHDASKADAPREPEVSSVAETE